MSILKYMPYQRIDWPTGDFIEMGKGRVREQYYVRYKLNNKPEYVVWYQSSKEALDKVAQLNKK